MVTDVVKILQAVFIVAVTYVQVGVNSSFGDITSVSFVLLPCNVADTLMGGSCDETAGQLALTAKVAYWITFANLLHRCNECNCQD